MFRSTAHTPIRGCWRRWPPRRRRVLPAGRPRVRRLRIRSVDQPGRGGAEHLPDAHRHHADAAGRQVAVGGGAPGGDDRSPERRAPRVRGRSWLQRGGLHPVRRAMGRAAPSRPSGAVGAGVLAGRAVGGVRSAAWGAAARRAPRAARAPRGRVARAAPPRSERSARMAHDPAPPGVSRSLDAPPWAGRARPACPRDGSATRMPAPSTCRPRCLSRTRRRPRHGPVAGAGRDRRPLEARRACRIAQAGVTRTGTAVRSATRPPETPGREQ